MKKREGWADLCKCIGIFFMVWGHAGVSTEMDVYLHCFHMPIFFFLSGYWFSSEKYSLKEFLKRRAKSLLIPYFFYGLVLCAAWNIYSLLACAQQFVPWTQILKSVFLFNADISPFAAVQWFLTALFFAEILFFLLIRLLPKKKWAPLLIAGVTSALGWLWPVWNWGRLPLALDCALTGTAFYALGYFLKICLKFPVDRFAASAAAPFLAAVLLGCGVVLSNLNGYTNMRVLLYGNYFLYYLCALSTILGMATLCVWIEKSGFWKTLWEIFYCMWGKIPL